MKRGSGIGLVCVSLLLGGATANAQEWKDSPEVQALYEAAQQEGRVVIWGTQNREVDWIPQAFEEMFPGVSVEFLGDNDIAAKAITEARGGRHAVDVFQTSLNAGIPVQERGLFTPADWSIFGIDEANVTSNGEMVVSHTTAYTLVYNPDQVDADELPDNWLDFAGEEFRGRMVGSLFLVPRLIGGIGLEIGEEAATDFARTLVNDSDMLMTRAPRETFVQTGERDIAFGEIDALVRVWIDAGLPVEYIVPEPVITTQFVVAVMDNAPNPNAARLLAGFLATPEGKARRAELALQYDYLPGTSDELPAALYERGATIVYDTVDNMHEREALINAVSPIITGQAQ